MGNINKINFSFTNGSVTFWCLQNYNDKIRVLIPSKIVCVSYKLEMNVGNKL